MPEIKKSGIRLLYFTSEQWPTFRADVATLFGKYLPRHQIHTDLVTELDNNHVIDNSEWGGGKLIACRVPESRSLQYILKTWHNLKQLIRLKPQDYDAIQVRDMPVTAFFALLIARYKNLPFFFWMSFPQSEGQIARAKSRGLKGGMRFWFPLIQGYVGKWLLYKVVLPRADHVFVQSKQMQLDMVKNGILFEKMTPVPMGIDLEVSVSDIPVVPDARLNGKRVLVYLGTLDRARNIELLFEMLVILRKEIPNIYLILAGDTEDVEHRDWLKAQALQLGVEDCILWTGWLPMQKAWAYVKAAEIGLSPLPRGYLLDSASPTKAIEYLGIGLPVIANDNPDQAEVLEKSGAGICVHLNATSFANAALELLKSKKLQKEMSSRGLEYVRELRSYQYISQQLSIKYYALFKI